MSSFYRILDFLKKQHILSLCCNTDYHHVWCANCFYVFNKYNMSFWIMTKLDTIHGSNLKKHPYVAGTINNQTKNILLVKGIQYKGYISILEGKIKKKHSIAIKKSFQCLL
ncbi:hypothetical protein [Candidatus Pantoea edessiphila]|uniref:hypothetical protein n=1 Tax=Candidatus Pantoea edessiphila TaxID=2044610 RepID=UPI0030D398C0